VEGLDAIISLVFALHFDPLPPGGLNSCNLFLFYYLGAWSIFLDRFDGF
jgi:hypothetical protein